MCVSLSTWQRNTIPAVWWLMYTECISYVGYVHNNLLEFLSALIKHQGAPALLCLSDATWLAAPQFVKRILRIHEKTIYLGQIPVLSEAWSIVLSSVRSGTFQQCLVLLLIFCGKSLVQEMTSLFSDLLSIIFVPNSCQAGRWNTNHSLVACCGSNQCRRNC